MRFQQFLSDIVSQLDKRDPGKPCEFSIEAGQQSYIETSNCSRATMKIFDKVLDRAKACEFRLIMGLNRPGKSITCHGNSIKADCLPHSLAGKQIYSCFSCLLGLVCEKLRTL